LEAGEINTVVCRPKTSQSRRVPI